ncbi:helix-turn-helix transcriptional regulator [Bradyrhizobium nanningense]|nr:AlpA family phage regulatory protein [Bradyrhizobium nanningense]
MPLPDRELLQKLLQHASAAPDTPDLMFDDREVETITGLSRTTRHRLEKAGAFPKGHYVSPGCKRWFGQQLAAWQRAIQSSSNPFAKPKARGGKGRASLKEIARVTPSLKG